MEGTLTQCSSEAIYELLEQEIISLTIKPGQMVGENELSQRFGVSRTPIRAVLRRLADRGLVEIIPYKGTQVSLLSMDEIEQMIYMRVAVEGMVLTDFSHMANPMLLEKLRYIIRKQLVLIKGSFDNSQFYTLDGQLHEVWFRATGKMHLWEMIKQSQVHYTRFRMMDIITAQKYPQIVAEHEQLFSAIEHQNSQEIRRIIGEHLYGGIDRLRPRIVTDFAEYFKEDPEPIKGLN